MVKVFSTGIKTCWTYKTAYAPAHKDWLPKFVSTEKVLFQFVGGEKVDFFIVRLQDKQLKAAFLSLLLPL